MGCAPSKQSAELQDADPEKRPLPAKEKKSPKSRKSPKKDRSDKKDKPEDNKPEEKQNNNASKEDGPIEETILTSQSAPTQSSAPPGHNGQAPVGEDDVDIHVQSNNVAGSPPGSPLQEIPAKYGDIWDMTKGMPSPTSPYDGDSSAPPKPERSFHSDEGEGGESKARSFHTFPRSRSKQRPQSAREKYLEEADSSLERKPSLRERTPQRRKDLDLSGNIYLGKNIELPGRGHKVDADTLEFLQHDIYEDNEKELHLPKTNVRELAQAYLESMKKRDDDKQPKSPIRRPVRKILEDDSDSESKHDISENDGNTSIIEVVNKEILQDYQEVPKKTFEEIEEERLKWEAEEAERERIRLEEEERIRVEEERVRAEEERIRAEEERIRAEEEARIRAEEEEKERLRLEEEERVLQEAQQREEEEQRRLREAERQLEEATSGDQLETVVEEVEAQVHESEGGDIDEAQTGAQLEDRFYNNKAFEKPDIDSSNPEQQDAALKIQTKYRQHHAKQVVGDKRQEQAAVKIQAGYRGWHDRKRVEGIKNDVDAKSQREAEEAQEDDARDDAINYEDPDVEAAATKIQAGFKGYKARKEVQEIKDSQETSQPEPDQEKTDDNNESAEPEPQTETAEPQSNEQEAPDQEDDGQKDDAIDYDDPDVQQAATKIQAGFKGMHARKQVKEMKDAKEGDKPAEDAPEQPAAEEPQQASEEPQEASEEPQQASEEQAEPDSEKTEEKTDDKPDDIDIDLNDPDVNKAATKIQAGFKGYKTRKELGAKKDGPDGEEAGDAEDKDADETAPQEDTAESQDKEEPSAENKDGAEQATE